MAKDNSNDSKKGNTIRKKTAKTTKIGDGDQNNNSDKDGEKKVTVITMMRVMTVKKGDGHQNEESEDNRGKS